MTIVLSIVLITQSIVLINISNKLRKKSEEAAVQANNFIKSYQRELELKEEINRLKNDLHNTKEVIISGKEYRSLATCPECGETGELDVVYYGEGMQEMFIFDCDCKTRWRASWGLKK